MHDLNTSRYFVHDSARCGTSGNLTWKEVRHDFVFPRGITTQRIVSSLEVYFLVDSNVDIEFDSVNSEHDQQLQVLTKLLSLSTTLETLILLPKVDVFA